MDTATENTNGGRSLKRRRIEDNGMVATDNNDINENNAQSSLLPPEVLGKL